MKPTPQSLTVHSLEVFDSPKTVSVSKCWDKNPPILANLRECAQTIKDWRKLADKFSLA
jgi:hypothetical protein